MNKFLFFLSSFVAIVVTRADPQYPAYYYQDVYPNPYAALPLAPNPYLGNNPNNRLFWNLWSTTTTTTSTSTTTCTVSTTACAGRRKRFVEFLAGEDDNIQPTLVQKVEVTEAAKMDQLVRKEREANPQLVSYRHLYFPGSFQPQPTFGSHYYPTYPKMYNRQQIVAGDPADSRLFFRITSTSTVTTTTTSRSTPGCSTSSNFNPC